MKKFIVILFSVIIAALPASAQYFTGFSVKSYKISSAWPTSFRSLKGTVAAPIGNTGDTRTMSAISATIYRNGKPFADGVCEDVTFRTGTASYKLNGTVVLSNGVSTWDAIGAALSFNASEYTVDFTVTITHADGHVDHVVRKGIPVTNYLRR